MTFAENAGLIENFDEIKQIVDEQYANPTVDRLMFIETLPKEDQEGKLFPCYIESWSEDEEGHLSLQCCIIQCKESEFGMVRVNIPEDEINTKKRFWDKPPKKAVRDETPWVLLGVEAQ